MFSNVNLKIFVAIVCLILVVPVSSRNNNADSHKISIKAGNEYGFNADSLKISSAYVLPKENFFNILSDFNIPASIISQLKNKSIIDEKTTAGKKYHTFYKADSLRYLVFENSYKNFTVINLVDIPFFYKRERVVTTRVRRIGGIIERDIYSSLAEAGLSKLAIGSIASALAYNPRFYRLSSGDAYKIVYEDTLISGKSAGTSHILGIQIIQKGNTLTALNLPENGVDRFVDENGNSIVEHLLRAPLNFKRISSPYSLERLHPVLKKVKPHYGTDYAAPAGTPVRAAGDGIITAAYSSPANGNYVIIKHDSIYETQYLHMFKFAYNVKTGKKVSQGDIIGYVGSSGLATGPHLCFRFWKNGEQIDPYSDDIPQVPVINDINKIDFYNKRGFIFSEFDRIKLPSLYYFRSIFS